VHGDTSRLTKALSFMRAEVSGSKYLLLAQDLSILTYFYFYSIAPTEVNATFIGKKA